MRIFSLILILSMTAFAAPDPICNMHMNPDEEKASAYCSGKNILAFMDKENKLVFANTETNEIHKTDMAASELEFNPSCSKLMVLGLSGNYVLDLENKSKVKIQTSADSKRSYTHDLNWMNDQNFIINGFDIKDNISSLKIMDSKTGTISESIKVPGKIDHFQFDKEQNSFVVSRSLNNRDEIINVKKIGNDWKEVVIRSNPGKFYRKFDVGEKYYFIQEDNDANFDPLSNRNILVIDKKTKKIIKRITGQSPVILNDNEIVFQRGEGAGEEYIYRYNLKVGKESQMTSPKENGNSRFELRKDSKNKGFSVVSYGPFNAIETFALNPDGKMKSISKVNFPEVSKVQRVSINSYDKFKYPAYVFTPNDKPKGVVMYIHGGDVNDAGNFSITNANREIYELNRNGYAVMAVQYRGDRFFDSSNKGTPFFGTKDAEDIFAAKKYLDKNMKGLPVFLYGFSHGASLVNLLVSKYSEENSWAGAITQFGVWDVDTKSYISLDNKTSECQKKLLSASNYVSSIKTPLLVIQGEKDSTSPISSFNKSKSKIPKDYLTSLVLKEGHRIEDCTTWKKTMDQILAFMDKERLKTTEGQFCVGCSTTMTAKSIDKISTISLKINKAIMELQSCKEK